ncbi:MAG: porin, partial [Alphaproteobacteria bacterium]|nr:porin [Alphaproteobacteria bacterium]
MKKIFLATTALAAVGMVSPAIADVTLSAYYELGWSSRSDDTPGDDGGADSFIFSDTEVHIKFDKVSDSGLEYGAAFELETGTTQGT